MYEKTYYLFGFVSILGISLFDLLMVYKNIYFLSGKIPKHPILNLLIVEKIQLFSTFSGEMLGVDRVSMAPNRPEWTLAGIATLPNHVIR
jgi:hypothetical protein